MGETQNEKIFPFPSCPFLPFFPSLPFPFNLGIRFYTGFFSIYSLSSSLPLLPTLLYVCLYVYRRQPIIVLLACGSKEAAIKKQGPRNPSQSIDNTTRRGNECIAHYVSQFREKRTKTPPTHRRPMECTLLVSSSHIFDVPSLLRTCSCSCLSACLLVCLLVQPI